MAKPAAYRSLPAGWFLSSHTQPQAWADHVLPDNERVGLLTAAYLAGRGHRLVAFYNEQPEHPGFATRGAAFCAAAADRGLECQSFVAKKSRMGVVVGVGPSAACVELVERLLGATPRPQAVLVTTDEQE